MFIFNSDASTNHETRITALEVGGGGKTILSFSGSYSSIFSGVYIQQSSLMVLNISTDTTISSIPYQTAYEVAIVNHSLLYDRIFYRYNAAAPYSPSKKTVDVFWYVGTTGSVYVYWTGTDGSGMSISCKLLQGTYIILDI